MSVVAVVGGGVSGLVAAYRLRRALGGRAHIVVLEASDRLGGKLRASELGDVGAEAFLARRPEVVELAEELGLGGDVVHPTAARATVRAGGRTLPLPARTVMGVPAAAGALGDVVSPEGAARIAAEPGLAPLPWSGADVAIGALVRERLGDEVVDRAVDPLLGGVYAGRADELSLRATVPALAAALDAGAPSLLAAASGAMPAPPAAGSAPAPVFGTLRGGLATLIDRLADLSRADVRPGAPVRGLARDGSRWRLDVAPGPLVADAVVLAVPARAASSLLRDVAPAAASAYGAVPAASMAVVAMALPPGTALPASSGVLIASGERRRDGTPFVAKAFTFSSRKWGHLGGAASPVLVRGSVGRFGEPGALERTDADLIAAVRRDLAELTGVDAPPGAALVQRWHDALPQYAVGHLERVAAIEREVGAIPGLAVCGAVQAGVGVPACVATATAAATRIAAAVRQDD